MSVIFDPEQQQVPGAIKRITITLPLLHSMHHTLLAPELAYIQLSNQLCSRLSYEKKMISRDASGSATHAGSLSPICVPHLLSSKTVINLDPVVLPSF